MTTEPKGDAQILARRTEKQWRHEDRELTSTHALWATLVTLHGAIAGLAGVLVSLGSSGFPRPAFISIGIMALVSMIGLARLNSLSRNADAARARYFETTSRKTWPNGFNQKKEDARTKDLQSHYGLWQKRIEKGAMFLFALSAITFGYFVTYR